MKPMKRTGILFIIALFPFTVTAQNFERMDFSKAFVAGMERRADIFRVMATNNGCIEFAGGSIMEDCEWKELFDNPRIINRGIDGNTTVDVLNRTEELTRHKPSKVFLEIGAKDLDNGVGMDTIIDNINRITRSFLAENSDTKIYIFSVLPAGKAAPGVMPGLPAATNDDVVAFNARLESFCKENRLTYLDLYPNFLNEDKTGLDVSLGISNSRLSVSGYGLLKDLLSDHVNQ